MVSGSAALRCCGCCAASAGRDRGEVRTLCHRATLCPVWGFSVPCAVRSWLWVGCDTLRPSAWPVVHPVASVGSVCGVGRASASPPPIAPPVPSCGLWGGCAPLCSCRGSALPLLTLSGSPPPRQLHHLRRHPLRLSPISYTHPGVSYFVDTVSVCIFIH